MHIYKKTSYVNFQKQLRYNTCNICSSQFNAVPLPCAGAVHEQLVANVKTNDNKNVNLRIRYFFQCKCNSGTEIPMRLSTQRRKLSFRNSSSSNVFIA